MKILFLGYTESPLIQFIRESGDKVLVSEAPITDEFVKNEGIEFIVSYGYKHLLKSDVLSLLPGKIINLHISFLPFNRGADPNFWSFMDDTPKGVSIHLVDEGIDTGHILVQKQVSIAGQETLRSSYALLQEEIQKLFRAYWHEIKQNNILPKKQTGSGTFHRKKDLEKYKTLLDEKGYDTPLAELRLAMNKK